MSPAICNWMKKPRFTESKSKTFRANKRNVTKHRYSLTSGNFHPRCDRRVLLLVFIYECYCRISKFLSASACRPTARITIDVAILFPALLSLMKRRPNTDEFNIGFLSAQYFFLHLYRLILYQLDHLYLYFVSRYVYIYVST